MRVVGSLSSQDWESPVSDNNTVPGSSLQGRVGVVRGAHQVVDAGDKLGPFGGWLAVDGSTAGEDIGKGKPLIGSGSH